MWVGLNMLMGLVSHNSDKLWAHCECKIQGIHSVAIIFNLWCGFFFVDSCMFLSVSNWGSVWVLMEQMMQKYPQQQYFFITCMHHKSSSMSSIPESCHSSCWNYKKSSQTVRNNNTNSISFAVLELPSSSDFIWKSKASWCSWLIKLVKKPEKKPQEE